MKKPIAVFALILAFNYSNAQTSRADPKDVQGWYGLGVKFDLPKKWTLDVDYQTRFINNLGDYNGSYFSVGGRKKVGKSFEVIGEYRLALVNRGTYHRGTLGGQYTIKQKPFEFSARLLVQNQLQDFVDPVETNDNDLFWRTRFQLKYQLSKKVETYVSTEPVMKIQGNRFVDNWRNTVGAKFKILPNTKLDVFYIYRPDYARRTYNRYFHILGVNVDYTVSKKKKSKAKA